MNKNRIFLIPVVIASIVIPAASLHAALQWPAAVSYAAGSAQASTPEAAKTSTPELSTTSVPETALTPGREMAETSASESSTTPSHETLPVSTPVLTPTPVPETALTPVPEPTQPPAPQPTSAPAPALTPTPRPISTPVPSPTVTLPEKGAQVTDSYGNIYKVTKKGISLQFIAPSPVFPQVVVIPARTQIGGVSYKVTSIGNNAFSGNNRLTKVSISSYVTAIGKNAFRNCTKLRTIYIPPRVTRIGNKAFYNCSRLCRIRIAATSLNSIGTNAFYKTGSKYSKNVLVFLDSSRLKKYRKMLKAAGLSDTAVFKS